MKKSGILLILAGMMVIAGCVTTKKKGDVSKFKRGYHSLTEHYNYWFNANELLRVKEQDMVKGYTENYNRILPVYPETTADPATYKKDFETAEKKAATGIGLHSLGHWTDDCYLLMGQAQFYRRDFETAEATFSYMKEEHNPNTTAKTKLKKSSKKKKSSASKKKTTQKKSSAKKKKSKKKKSSKKKSSAKSKTAPKDKNADKTTPTTATPDKSSKTQAKEEDDIVLEVTGQNPYKKTRRTAAYPEAMIWYGRTLVAREKYEEAEFQYRELWEDPWFPRSLRDELSKAEADMWMQQKQYDKAVVSLDKAIRYATGKKDRARLAFIQAQLYERNGNTEKAYAALETVLANKPDYILEFNARLHQTLDGWNAGTIKSAAANRSLERMLKDAKNKEYQDQIYFAMGEIALADGLKKDAIGYFRQSLAASTGNTAQRAEAYLKLANLYYDREEFVSAKLYFDSAVTVLPTSDERYAQANLNAKNLTEISRLITTIANNDSIIRVYNMSDAERLELAKKIKKERDDAAAKLAAEAEAKKADVKPGATVPIANAGAKASTFYFYSDAGVKKGKKDFERTWGTRKLEDNWRRNQRVQSDGGNGGDENIASDANTKGKETEATDASTIFKDLPRTEAELAVIHLGTYEAMYKLGTLYRDLLTLPRKSVTVLEDMQTRYPDTARYEKETWYYCFLDHTDLGNKDRAQVYLDTLVNKYPNSSFARALSDPNYLNASKEREKDLNRYYEQTFQAFQKGDYRSAYDRCADAPKKYGSTNPIMPKFMLLSALCTGNLQGNDAYCKSLNDVIARFPDSPEATRAKEIARLIACKGFETSDPKRQDIDEAFVTEDDKLHYFMVAFAPSGEVKLDGVKNAIADYNSENHKSDQLRMSNIYLGKNQEQPVIVLRKFDNKAKAMQYLNEVKNKKDFLGETNKTSYQKELFIITQENYRRVLKNKTLDGYREFFESNYK